MSLKVNLRHLETRDVSLRGELAADALALEHPDELVHAGHPVEYDLTAHKAGPHIVVQGRLSMDLDCECSRCLKPFQHKVIVDPWVCHLSLEGEEKVEVQDDSVDLTPFVREDILLEYPQHPLCDADCAGLPKQADAQDARKLKNKGSAAATTDWSVLNKLKF